jgi:hypothetical protein
VSAVHPSRGIALALVLAAVPSCVIFKRPVALPKDDAAAVLILSGDLQ